MDNFIFKNILLNIIKEETSSLSSRGPFGKNVQYIIDLLLRINKMDLKTSAPPKKRYNYGTGVTELIYRDPYIDKIINVLHYLDQRGYINYIGKGDFRMVYEINDDYVLKVNYVNETIGLKQTEKESSLGNILIWKDLAPQVVFLDPKKRWVISEKVIPINTESDEKKWLELLGLNEFNINKISDLKDVLLYFDLFKFIDLAQEHKKYPSWKQKEEDIKSEEEYEEYKFWGPFNKRNFLIRFLSDKIFKNDLKNMSRDLVNLRLSEFFNNKFIKTAFVASKEVGLRLNDYTIENLGFGKDGRPVVLDTGY